MDVWPVPSSSQLFALNSPIILRSCFLNVKHLPILEPSPCLVPTSCSFHLSIHFQPGLSRIFRYAFCIYSTVTNTTMTIETQCVGKSFVLAVSTSPAFVIFQSFKCGGGFWMSDPLHYWSNTRDAMLHSLQWETNAGMLADPASWRLSLLLFFRSHLCSNGLILLFLLFCNSWISE